MYWVRISFLCWTAKMWQGKLQQEIVLKSSLKWFLSRLEPNVIQPPQSSHAFRTETSKVLGESWVAVKLTKLESKWKPFVYTWGYHVSWERPAKEYCSALETASEGRKKIRQETLGNLVKSMPDRVGDIVKNTGYYESNSFEIYIFLTWDRHIKGVLLSFTSYITC